MYCGFVIYQIYLITFVSMPPSLSIYLKNYNYRCSKIIHFWLLATCQTNNKGTSCLDLMLKYIGLFLGPLQLNKHGCYLGQTSQFAKLHMQRGAIFKLKRKNIAFADPNAYVLILKCIWNPPQSSGLPSFLCNMYAIIRNFSFLPSHFATPRIFIYEFLRNLKIVIIEADAKLLN